jgi:hypothetical protein
MLLQETNQILELHDSVEKQLFLSLNASMSRSEKFSFGEALYSSK